MPGRHPRRSPMRAVAVAVALGAAGAVMAACGGEEPSAGAVGDGRRSTTTDASAGSTTTPAARPSAGCAAGTGAAVASERRTVTVDGQERWYLLTTPDRPDESPVPLVVDFHGLAEGAEVHTRMSAYGELGRREGFVVAVPQGQGAVPAWNPRLTGDNPDLRFIDALVDQLSDQLCLDTSRVYATGLSNGAFMSSALACARADRFAAVVPVAGVQFPQGCSPSRPVPVMAFHGTADPILLFNGGVGDLMAALAGTPPTVPAVDVDLEGEGYPAAVRAWAAANGCEAAPRDSRVSDHVLRRTYDCPAGAEVVFHVVTGGGHSWPGSRFNRTIERITGPTTMEVDATRLGWEFLRRHRLPS